MFCGLFGPFWGQETACIDPFPIGVGPPALSVSGSNLSVSRPQKSFGATLGHLGCFLGAKMVQDSPTMASRWLRMASRLPKMIPRWPQDGLTWLQDGFAMLQHSLLGPSWATLGPSWGHLEANLAPCWANLVSSCTSQAKI